MRRADLPTRRRARRSRPGVRAVVAALLVVVLAPMAPLGAHDEVAPALTAAATTGGSGAYWLVASDGGIFGFGGAPFLGSTGALRLAQPIVGMASTPTGSGYWLVASDGGIFAFGDAAFLGSTGALRLAQPIVAMASTPSGRGYWLVASDGGIFAFGGAPFLGSTGALRLAQPIVGMASTPTGSGYWLVASDGGIFAFGDAAFLGSTGALRLAQPIVGMASTPSGRGYWLVASDGGIFAFGDARFAGSTGALRLARPIVGMATTPTGGGYWLTASDGGIFAFGDAVFSGSTGALSLTRPVVGLQRAVAGALGTVPATSTTPMTGTAPITPTSPIAPPAASTSGGRTCAAFPAMPDASCTGVPAGTVLTPVSGTITVTQPGTLIEGRDLTGCIVVRASNVTIRRSRVRSSPCANSHQIDVEYGAWSNVLIEDVEIDGLSTTGFGAGIGNSGFTCRRCNIHHVGQGANLSDNAVIEDSYIHDLVSEGNAATSGSHNEAIISNGGSNLTIRHNNLDGETRNATSALSLFGDFDPIVNVLVQNNLFNGGGYCVHGGSVPGKAYPKATGVRFVDNLFGQAHYAGCGYYGPVIHFDARGTGNVWSGNAWQATGQPVNP